MTRPRKKTIVKKSKKTLTKKQPASLNKNSKIIIFGLCLIILGCGIFILTQNKLLVPYSNAQKPQYSKINTDVLSAEATPASVEASISPTPSPTPSPSPNLTPIVAGRSIEVPILYYHYIGNNPNPADTARDGLSIVPELFEQEMNYVSVNGYNTITFDQLYAALKGTGTLPPKPLLLTFDDGYVDFFVNAFPILQKYHLKATSFIPTGLIDQGYYMKWEQILQMNQSGLISFQAHSVTHANLPTLSDAQLHFEVFESKRVLEDKLKQPVNFFAYPYGTANGRVEQVVREAGFEAATGTWYSKTETEGTQYDMPRIRMGGKVSMQEFINNITL